MFLLSLSLIIPLFIGFLLILLFWPTQQQIQSHLIIKCCLAIGLGFGVSSYIFFVWLAVFGQLGKGSFIIEIVLLIVLVAFLLYKIKSGNYLTCSEPHFDSVSNSTIRQILSIGFYIALTSAVALFLFLSLKSPHGGGIGDAWEDWNLRARFIFRGGDHWTDYFFINFSNPDYPLLIPATIARSWEYIGNETLLIPVLVATLFTFATVGLIFSSISILRSKSQGFLAGLILLGTPFFVIHGASQYADVPLGFFFLATIALFALQQRLSVNKPSLLTLAGMTAGFSAWTKNEGLLFLVAIMVSHFIVVTLKGWRTYVRQVFSFLIGVIPVLIIIIYFKTRFAPPNTFLSGQSFQSTMGRLTDFSRYLQVLKAFVRGFFHFGDWSLVVNLPLLLVFYILIVGINIEAKERSGILTSIIVLILTVVGYFVVYVTTPQDLTWHLSTSLDRLFLQIWPSFIFTYFLIVRTPEKTLIMNEN